MAILKKVAVLHTKAVKVLYILLDVVAEAFDDPCFQLPGAFFSDAVFVAHVFQGQRCLGEDAVTQDVFFPLIEGLREFGQLPPEERFELGIGQSFVRRLLMRGQDIHERAIVFLADGLIERQFPAAQPLIHFDDIAFAHVETIRQQLAVGREAFPFELGLFLLQIVKSLR